MVRLRPAPADIIEACAEAARLLRHGRDDIPVSLLHRRARQIAMAAINEAFPRLRLWDIAKLIGLTERELNHVEREHAEAHNEDWWEEGIVDEIVGLLVTPVMGARAR